MTDQKMMTLAMMEMTLSNSDWREAQQVHVQIQLVQSRGEFADFQARIKLDDGEWQPWQTVDVAVGAPPAVSVPELDDVLPDGFTQMPLLDES